jgi:uncharacterized protein
MHKVELHIVALNSSESHPGNFVVILEEADGLRKLPVIIGTFEAQSIAVALEGMQPNRPLTHDSFRTVIESLGASLKEIRISSVQNNIFHSVLVLSRPGGEPVLADVRTSDALALAVRFGCPIFTSEEILSEVGILSASESKMFTTKRGGFDEYTLEELEQLLANLLAKEDFESAARIRDAIERRSAD